MKKVFVIISTIILPIVIIFTAYHIMFPKKETNNREVKIPEGVKIDSVVVFKLKHSMTLLAGGKEIKSYYISLGKDPVGHKQKEGDKKTPEGNYVLDRKVENSRYHLAIHISYPNEQDKLNAEKSGYSPGGDIMIHGLPNNLQFLQDYYSNTDWTDGCIAVTNDAMDEIWKLVDAGTPIMINP